MNSGGALKAAGYSPPAGTASGIPGASYPVLGSAPVTNMQPRYANPGISQMRPSFSPAAPAAGQAAAPTPQSPGGSAPNPQMLAQALARFGANRG